ncbi:SulP family inorganic anion transporter [Streptomyces sp. NPDC002403]
MGAGLVTGHFSIPEGMAYASITGFNPIAGLTRHSCLRCASYERASRLFRLLPGSR